MTSTASQTSGSDTHRLNIDTSALPKSSTSSQPMTPAKSGNPLMPFEKVEG